MNKKLNNTTDVGHEKKILLFLSAFFISLMISAWFFSIDLRKTIIAKNSLANSNAQALVDTQQLRNLSDSEISSSLSFFLMGSTNIFDAVKKEKLTLSESLINFQKQYNLPKLAEIVKRIETLRLQHQDFFDQAMAFPRGHRGGQRSERRRPARDLPAIRRARERALGCGRVRRRANP